MASGGPTLILPTSTKLAQKTASHFHKSINSWMRPRETSCSILWTPTQGIFISPCMSLIKSTRLSSLTEAYITTRWCPSDSRMLERPTNVMSTWYSRNKLVRQWRSTLTTCSSNPRSHQTTSPTWSIRLESLERTVWKFFRIHGQQTRYSGQSRKNIGPTKHEVPE